MCTKPQRSTTRRDLSDQGRYSDAEPLFRAASRTWQSVGFATGIALVEANLGRLATRTGRFDHAAERLASAADRFERLHARAFVDEVTLRSFENTLHSDATVSGLPFELALALAFRHELRAIQAGEAEHATGDEAEAIFDQLSVRRIVDSRDDSAAIAR